MPSLAVASSRGAGVVVGTYCSEQAAEAEFLLWLGLAGAGDGIAWAGGGIAWACLCPAGVPGGMGLGPTGSSPEVMARLPALPCSALPWAVLIRALYKRGLGLPCGTEGFKGSGGFCLLSWGRLRVEGAGARAGFAPGAEPNCSYLP